MTSTAWFRRKERLEWDIFISYRRSPATGKLAKWLKEELEQEPIEATTGQVFHLDVFVDATEPHHADFQRNLIPILQHSRALIVLADKGSATRNAGHDYLYQELDWWAERRKTTPFIVVQIDPESGRQLLKDSKLSKWKKINCLDCFFHVSADSVEVIAEKKDLIRKLRESIRDYGQVIQHFEVRRLRRRALVAVTFAAIAILTAGVAWWLKGIADKRSVEASISNFASAHVHFAKGEWRDAIAYLGRSLYYNPENKAAAQLLWNAVVYGTGDRIRFPQHVLAHGDLVWDAEFSPDGTRVATASSDGVARIWDSVTGKQVFSFRPPDAESVHSVEFDPGGKTLIAATGETNAAFWDATTGLCLDRSLNENMFIEYASWSPDGHRIATTGDEKSIRIWNAETQKPEGETMTHIEPGGAVEKHHSSDGELRTGYPGIQRAVFSPDSRLLVSTGWDNFARMWDVGSHRAWGRPLRHDSRVQGAAFRPDGRQVATVGQDGAIRFWETETGNPSENPVIEGDKFVANAACFSPDGLRITVAYGGGTAKIFNTRNHRKLVGDLFQAGELLWVNFSPQGDRVITASRDAAASIWEIRVGTPKGIPLVHRDGVTNAAFSPDGLSIVTGSFDGMCRVWNADTGLPAGPELPHPEWVRHAAFSNDGSVVATTCHDGLIRFWDWHTGREAGSAISTNGVVDMVTFDPRHSRISYVLPGGVGSPSEVTVWDLEKKRALASITKELQIHSVSFDPSGTRIVTSCDEGLAEIWDALSGTLIGAPFEHPDRVTSAVFSPDGSRIATGGSDGVVRIWDISTHEQLPLRMEHEDVLSVVFSPDGKRLLSCGADNTARLWDAETGQMLALPFLHQHTVRSAVFSPDGQNIVTASVDKTARIWEVPIPPRPERRWIEDLTSALSARRFSKLGILEDVGDTSRMEMVHKLQEILPTNDPWAELLRWSLDAAPTRPFTPRCKISARQVTDRLLSTRSPEMLDESLSLDPTNPRLPLAFAESENDSNQAAWLRRYAPKRDISLRSEP